MIANNTITINDTSGTQLSQAEKHAFAFIKTIVGKANAEAYFRTFDDNADRKAKQFNRKFNSSLKPIIGELHLLNAKGAGVFMVVNAGGQRNDEITHVRAVFADTDGAPLEPLLCLKPHLVVESSPGKWHVYWRVNENFPLDQFKPVQIAIAQKFGTDPNVNDLPRVMRVPGFNHCKGEAYRVRIRSRDAELPRYSLQEIVAGLGLNLTDQTALNAHSSPAWVAGTGNLTSVTDTEHPPSDANLVADNCKQIADFRNTGGESEPIWYNALGVIKFCVNGENIAHDWSSKHDDYSYDNTQAKIDQWQYGPTTCERFREINPKGCEGCAHTCKSPISLGVNANAPTGLPEWLLEMNSRYVWVNKDAAIYRIKYRDFIQMEKFHAAHANQTHTVQTNSGPKDIAQSRLWLAAQFRRQHEAIVTRPGEPEITDDNCLNDWAGFTVEANAGDVAPFKNMYGHLFGSERFPLLWLAHLIQFPGIKMFVALVIWSLDQGVGKNLFFETVGALFSRHHFKLIGQSEVDDDFCGWIPGAIFVIADETRASKNARSCDKLKLWQTASFLRTHDKGQPKREVENLMNMVFLSNHADGMFLSDQDRRFYVHEIKSGPLPESLKQEFLRWRDNGGLEHLLHYLRNIDLTGFDPKGRAPVTESKREMIEASRSDLDRWALDIVSGSLPIGKEVATADELTRRFMQEFPHVRTPPSVSVVGKVLVNMGAYRRANQVRLNNGRKVRALALVRPDYWKDQPEASWREELEKRS